MNNFFQFSEVGTEENQLLKLSKEVSNKETDLKVLDQPLAKEINAEKFFLGCPVEGHNGYWEGESGNSKWIPVQDFIPSAKSETGYNNSDSKTMEGMFDKYEIDGISFNKGEQDFSEVIDLKVLDQPLAKEINVEKKFLGCPVEGHNGHWEGDSGNSKWIPDKDFVPSAKSETGYNNPDSKTMKEILDKYGIDGISFNEGEPDFSEVSKGNVQIKPFSERRSVNFARADMELAKQKGCSPEEVKQWRVENGYTWHELKDMKTMQKVPHEIHANIPHRGGISEIKNGVSDDGK